MKAGRRDRHDPLLYDIDRRATEKALRNLKGSCLKLVACTSAENAVEGAQIITTATADKQFATILRDNMVGPGVHINAIGGDCPGKTELHRDILLRADTFRRICRRRLGSKARSNRMDRSYSITELWRVVAGLAPGRRDVRQITLFDSVGFAIEDFSALQYVRERVAETGFCEALDMIADPDDPRDLFGMLERAR